LRIAKQVFCFILTFLLIVTVSPFNINAAIYSQKITVPTAATTKIITQKVSPELQWKEIQDILDSATTLDGKYLKIVFEDGITYRINKPLFIQSNTIIEAQGAVIERVYDGSQENSALLMNGPKNEGERKSVGGYSLNKNIYIHGGIWTGGNINQATKGGTNVCMVHTSNVNIWDASFKNNYGGHLIEVNASRNVIIQNCSFNGYRSDGKDEDGAMALQIDMAHGKENCKEKPAGEHAKCQEHDSVPTGYKEDNTACNTIQVLDCKFNSDTQAQNNFGVALGSDKTLTSQGIYHTNITMSGNVVNNTTGEGIAVRGYKNSKIIGNTVKNSAEKGIAVKRGDNISVENNIISGTKNKTGHGIFVYELSKNIKLNNNKIKNTKGHGVALEGKAQEITVNNNSIENPGAKGISVMGAGTIANSISNNQINASSEQGIFIYDNGNASIITSNTIKNGKSHGIGVLKSSRAESIKFNTIDNCAAKGINTAENSKVDVISSNNILNCRDDGIYLGTKASAGIIGGNKIQKCYKNGINIYNFSIVSNINGKNQILNCNGKGISISTNSKVTSTITDNSIMNNGDHGIILYKKSFVKNISKNTIRANKGKGLCLVDNSSVNSCSSNVVTGNRDKAYYVSPDSKGQCIPGYNIISVRSISVNLKSATMGVKEKLQLKTTISPKNSTNKNVAFQSSNKKVVVVDRKGKITAKKVGKAKIIAATNNKKKVTVNIIVKKTPKSVKFKKKKIIIKKKKSTKLKYSLSKGAASYSKVWKSSKPSVASVDKRGKVKAKKKGKTYITIKLYNGKKAKVKIIVK